MFKKFISAVLALSLVFGSAAVLPEEAVSLENPISASANEQERSIENGFEYKVLDNGTVEIIGHNGPDLFDAKDIVIPSKIAGKKVTSIADYALAGGLRFESVTIPNTIEKIGIGVFGASDKIKNVYVQGTSNYFVSVDGVLYTKNKKTLVYFPAARTNFKILNSVTSFADGAIYWNYGLKSLVIPEGVTKIGKMSACCGNYSTLKLPKSLKSIGAGSFGRCTNVKKVTVPEGVTTIEESTFSTMTSLESIKLPSTLKTIDRAVFAGCSSLETITIPSNVTSIGEHAIDYCPKLKKVIICGNVKTLGDEFTGYYGEVDEKTGMYVDHILNKNLVIYCKKGTAVEKYAKANGIKYKIITAHLSDATITGIKNRHYTGKAITPKPVVKVGTKTLKEGVDYTVSYKNNTKIGTATVTIKGKGNYIGTVSKTFKICSKKTTLKTVSSPSKGQLKASYAKQSNITAYQVTYALDKNFTKGRASKSSTKLSKTISGLKSGKTYYVKVRTYKTVDGERYYSGYSSVIKVKVK